MASFMWTSVFVLLMAELALTMILVIPVPQRMRNWICREVSKFHLKERLKTPLLFIGGGLGLALLDCFSQLRWIFNLLEDDHDIQEHHHDSHILHQMDKEREYRTERNIYLAGFALTLLFVIGRITDLMQEHADLEAGVASIGSTTPTATAMEAPAKPIEAKKKD